MIIKRDQLRQFARYQIPYDYDFDEYESYQISYDDVRELLNSLKKRKKDSLAQFAEEWLMPLNYDYDLCTAIGLDPWSEGEWNPHRGLLESRENVMNYVLNRLFSLFLDSDDDNRKIEEIYDLDELEKVFSDYEANCLKPFEQWEFIEDVKDDYLNYVDIALSNGEELSEEEISLFKRYVEELIALNNLDALRIKGNMCYGGSPVYECDWYTSRDCFEKAYEMTGDPGFANSLGYISYYGRCNDGVPEYDKAFKYFLYGHCNDWYESSYKLADMFRNGYGVKKNSRTAFAIYTDLYEHALEDLCYGHDKKFADVALRVASMFEEREMYLPAYDHYLQADMAIRRRQQYHFYGDESVYKKIQDGLERVKGKLDREEFSEIRNEALVLDAALLKDYVCYAVVKDLKHGFKMTIARTVKRSESRAAQILVTLASKNYCTLTDKVDLYFSGTRDDDSEFFMFDDYQLDWDDDEDREIIRFYLFGNEVARFNFNCKYRIRK